MLQGDIATGPARDPGPGPEPDSCTAGEVGPGSSNCTVGRMDTVDREAREHTHQAAAGNSGNSGNSGSCCKARSSSRRRAAVDKKQVQHRQHCNTVAGHYFPLPAASVGPHSSTHSARSLPFSDLAAVHTSFLSFALLFSLTEEEREEESRRLND